MLYRAIGSAAEDKIIRIAQARINSSKVMPCSERPRLRFIIMLRILQTIAYGCTCSVASPVTSGIGFCCESLALTWTMDTFEEPGAIAFTTIPMIVPVPLTPAVLGCRVAEIIACPCSLSPRFAEPHPEHTDRKSTR